jgi:hypothetical protein
VHTCNPNPSTRETEVGRSRVQGQHGQGGRSSSHTTNWRIISLVFVGKVTNQHPLRCSSHVVAHLLRIEATVRPGPWDPPWETLTWSPSHRQEGDTEDQETWLAAPVLLAP